MAQGWAYGSEVCVAGVVAAATVGVATACGLANGSVAEFNG